MPLHNLNFNRKKSEIVPLLWELAFSKEPMKNNAMKQAAIMFGRINAGANIPLLERFGNQCNCSSHKKETEKLQIVKVKNIF